MKDLEQRIEGFLTDYGASILSIDKKYPEWCDRCCKLEGLRRKGIKRIKGLIAEFGN